MNEQRIEHMIKQAVDAALAELEVKVTPHCSMDGALYITTEVFRGEQRLYYYEDSANIRLG